MKYYLITQNTKNIEPISIIINDLSIEEDGNLMYEIRQEFFLKSKKFKKVVDNDKIKIMKNNNDYLISGYSMKKDWLNRDVPIEILIIDYNESEMILPKIENSFQILNDIVPFDINEWKNIDEKLKFNNEKKNKNFNLILVSIILIILFTLVVYIIK
jgi:hypothetical protein